MNEVVFDFRIRHSEKSFTPADHSMVQGLRHQRIMSSAGKKLFKESVWQHTAELAVLTRNIDSFTPQCMEQGVNLSDVERTQEHVNDLLKRCDKSARIYEQFLHFRMAQNFRK